IVADLKSGTAAIESVSARLAGLAAGLNASITGIDGDAPEIGGNVHLQIDSLQRTLGTLAVPLPITADETVLQTLKLTAGFKAGSDTVEVSDIVTLLDDSNLTGRLALNNFEQPAITFDLALDAINLDRYLPPPDETEAETPPADGEAAADPEIQLPVEMLRTLNLDGRFKIGALQVMNLKTANIDTGLKAKDGIVDLEPLAVDLYQGQFRGAARLDVTGEVPVYTSTLQLSDVTVGPLMQDFMDKRLLEGLMNVEAEVNTTGNRVSGLMQELDGKFALAFRDGALSMNVRESLRNVRAKLRGEQPDPNKPVGEPTKFSSITASGVIENGTVKNQDLEVKARHLYVTGKGSYQLPTEVIDYVLTILLSDDGAGQDDPLNDLYDFPIEFPLKGKLDEINYASVGLKALGSAVTGKVKAEVGAAKDAAKAELQRKQEAARAELERLEAEKKAEVERQRKAREEELKKKLEEKKKEAIRKLFD
ncbi:MAG TPA: AsmA family protein, partial [Gammaproteobacteria bacterium]